MTSMIERSKKRRMVQFRIGEISSVDIPAQRGATAAIIKNRSSENADRHLAQLRDAVAKLNGQTTEYPMTIEKRLEALEIAILGKRADEEYPYLPGTAEEKGRILKHLEALPADVRKVAMNMLKAGDSAINLAFDGVHPKHYANKGDPNTFMKKVEEARKANPKLSRLQAMAKARKDHPEEFAAYDTATRVAN